MRKPKLGRGRCPYCAKTRAVRGDGKMHKHYITIDGLGPHGRQAVCGGSGQPANVR